MVKTRSSARVGGAANATPTQNGVTNEPSENGRYRNNGYNRNSQAMAGSGVAGSGGGGQGKDPLAQSMPNRGMYQHPGVGGGYPTQDSRAQQMPVAGSLYATSAMYHGYGATAGNALAAIPSGGPAATIAPYPIHPDVKFKNLPFYDVMAELMKPSTMVPSSQGRMQEAVFQFSLTPQQASEIALGKDIVGPGNKMDYVVQAQMRFCLMESSSEQEDNFPPNVTVKINNKLCPLPNPLPTNKPTPEPKRPPRPVNISSLVKLSPTVSNCVQVSWAADFTRAFVCGIFLVRKLTSAELLVRLKNKGTKNPDYTRSLIKEKLSDDYDNEVATTSLRVSLMCPLGKARMQCPCRSTNCPHLQCFDASLFLQMNERRPTWLCPVCNRPAPYDTLVVDGYFLEVLTSPKLASNCNEIHLHNDGTWSAYTPVSKPSPDAVKTEAESVNLISDDVEVIPLEGPSDAGPAAKKSAVGDEREPRPAPTVDLTSDSEDELPLKRKQPVPKSSPKPAPEDSYTPNPSEVVSSSGYRSPAACGVISLDSPSPPAATSPPALPALPALPSPTTVTITPVAPGTNVGECDDNEATPSARWTPFTDESDYSSTHYPSM